MSLLEGVGFTQVTCMGTTGISTSAFTIGALLSGLKPEDANLSGSEWEGGNFAEHPS